MHQQEYPGTALPTHKFMVPGGCLCPCSCVFGQLHLHCRAGAHILPFIRHGHLQPGSQVGLHCSPLLAHGRRTSVCGWQVPGESRALKKQYHSSSALMV